MHIRTLELRVGGVPQDHLTNPTISALFLIRQKGPPVALRIPRFSSGNQLTLPASARCRLCAGAICNARSKSSQNTAPPPAAVHSRSSSCKPAAPAYPSAASRSLAAEIVSREGHTRGCRECIRQCPRRCVWLDFLSSCQPEVMGGKEALRRQNESRRGGGWVVA